MSLTSFLKKEVKEKFRAKDHCFFNPTFGEGSILVGGVDVDIIIDGALLNIKKQRR